MPVLRYIVVLLAGLLAYFGFGYLLVGRDVFQGTWLIGAVFISVFILLGPAVQSRLRRRTIAEYPRCGRCGYNLIGHARLFASGEAICPECGERLVQTSVVTPGLPDERQVSRAVEKVAMIAGIVGTVAVLGFALMSCFTRKWSFPPSRLV